MSALSWVRYWSWVLLTAFMSWRLHDATSQYILYTHTHSLSLWHFKSYNESPFLRLIIVWIFIYYSVILWWFTFVPGNLTSQISPLFLSVGGWVPVCWWHHLREVQRALRDDAGGSKAVGNYLPFLYGHRSDNECSRLKLYTAKRWESKWGYSKHVVC